MKTRFSWLFLLLLSACGGDANAPDTDAGEDAATVFVVAGDFTSGQGVASTIGLPSLRVTRNVVEGVASDDPVLRYQDGRLYIVNRLGHDNITILDAGTLALVDQVSTGGGSNPQDVVARGDTLYVAALAAPGVLVIDASGAIDMIDLSALDPDGIPDCSSLHLAGDTLLVACGVLDNFMATGPGKIAVIDTTSNTVVTSFELSTANPVGFLRPTPAGSALGGDLLLSTVIFGPELTTGCVQRIGVEPPAAKGCLVENAVLGGYATGLAYRDDTLVIAVTSGFDASGAVATLRAFDASAGTLLDAPVVPAEHRSFDVAVCPSGELVAADAAGGMRVYDASGEELGAGLLDIGLPPIGNCVVCY